jgi:nucleotide-binding universal stress UspA family protein
MLPSRVLVPYDGKEDTLPSVRYAAALTAALGASLDVLHVVTHRQEAAVASVQGQDVAAARAFCERRGNAALDELRRDAGLEEHSFRAELVFAESLAAGVEDYAERRGIDVFVMRLGRGQTRAKRDLGASLRRPRDRSFLYVKGFSAFPASGGRFLVAIEGHPDSVDGARRTVELAAALSASVTFLHVLRPGVAEPDAAAARNLNRATELADEKGVRSGREALQCRSTDEGLVRYAIVEDVDLIVMRQAAKTIWGSVAENVNRRSCHDVLLLREGSE